MSNIQPLVLHTFLDECVFVKRSHSGNFYVSAVDTSLDINAASLSKCRVTQGRVWPQLLNKSMMVARQRGCWHNWNSHGRCVCVCVCVHTFHMHGLGGEVQTGKFSEWPMANLCLRIIPPYSQIFSKHLSRERCLPGRRPAQKWSLPGGWYQALVARNRVVVTLKY